MIPVSTSIKISFTFKAAGFLYDLRDCNYERIHLARFLAAAVLGVTTVNDEEYSPVLI